MYGYVYKTTDLRNNKIYVGQHKSETFDSNYYGSGVIIKPLIEKYGTHNFSCEILSECYSKEDLDNKEIFWIKELDSRNPNIGYNIASGGAFGDSGYHQGMKGKHQSEKQKLAASKACSYKRSEESRKKMAIAKIGNNNGHGNKGREGTFKGKTHTEKTKKLISEKISPIVKEYHKNLSEEDKIKRGNNISNSKKGCINVTDGIKNYYIKPEKLNEYLSNGYYRMSLSKYKKLINK